jgi:Fic family protein
MHNLPLYSEGRETHGLALRRQRDAVLEKASKCPQRLADGVEALVRECVFETLRLTGAPVTRQAVAEVWAGTAEPGEVVGRELIRGQRDALHALRQAAGSRPELTPGLVREVHRLSSPPSAGGFRTRPIAAQFTAAAPSRPDLISDKVANLCDWLTADSGRTMHPPEKAGLAFARLLEISPFEHGNFRTAHLLLSFFAFTEGYPPFFLRLEEADQVREEVERAMVFETLPLVNRLARALASSLSFCLEALSSGSSEKRPRS